MVLPTQAHWGNRKRYLVVSCIFRNPFKVKCLTLICIAVEVLVVWVSILVCDLRVDFTSGI